MYQEAVMGGGGDDWYNVILLTATTGVTVTITDGDEEVEIVGTGLQQAVTIHNENSTYTISASENGLPKSASSVTTDTISGKLFTRELKMAAIEVTFDDDFRSQPFTISDGTTTSTSQTFPSTGNTVDIFVPNTGTWKVASSAGGESYESRGAIVTDLDLSYTDEIVVIPNGQTVLPVNDIQTWLACANIKDKTSYTTLADVLNDEVTLVKLMSDSNAVDYLKRSTEWISVNRDGLVPAMTSNTQPEGVAFANIATAANAYKVFDPTYTSYTNPTSGTLMNGYQFTSAKNVKRAVYNLWRQSGSTELSYTVKLQGSNDGTNYTDLGTNSVYVGTTSGLYECVIDAPNNSSNYLYYRVISDENWVNGIGIRSLQFYETTSGEFGITQDELAMQAIGAYDYAANTLLSDEDWSEAITKSEYYVSVLNVEVPKMTNYTTPSGEVTYSHDFGNFNAWKAFNSDEAYGWLAGSTYNPNTENITYDFGVNVCITNVKFKTIPQSSSDRYTQFVFKIEGSTDGTNFATIKSDLSAPNTGEYYLFGLENNNSYRYYRLQPTQTTPTTFNAGLGLKIQYYGREAGGVQSWLKAAGLFKPYTTLEEVIADSDALATLVTDHDAVDYLVTAKALIDGIVSSEKAMMYIGARNYCANTLLGDEDWAEAISLSEYYDLVLNATVPIMTSATEPSGEVTESSYLVDAYKGWHAFDTVLDSPGWIPATSEDSGGAQPWLQYDFGENKQVCITKITFKHRANMSATFTVKLMGSNDGFVNDSHDVFGNFEISDLNIHTIAFANDSYYRYYRLVYLSKTSTSWNQGGGDNYRFYGREEVSESYITFYSAAQDTIYYLDDQNEPVTVCTTGDDGKGQISKQLLPVGRYKLYSTYAKDPYDLSNPFTKIVNINSDTFIIWFMPFDIGDLCYWYGVKSRDYVTNLYIPNQSQSSSVPTEELRYLSCAKANWCTFGKRLSHDAYQLAKAIVELTNDTTTQGCQFIEMSTSSASIYNSRGQYDQTGNVPLLTTFDKDNLSNNKSSTPPSGIVDVGYTTTSYAGCKAYGLWVEPEHLANANFFGAANDTVYYEASGGIQVLFAQTNDIGEAYVDYSKLIPGQYTLISSVAKKTTDLTAAYSKQVTIALDTNKIYFMPDNTLYWYGWGKHNFEGGGSHFTHETYTYKGGYDVNIVNKLVPSIKPNNTTQWVGFSSVKPIDLSKYSSAKLVGCSIHNGSNYQDRLGFAPNGTDVYSNYASYPYKNNQEIPQSNDDIMTFDFTSITSSVAYYFYSSYGYYGNQPSMSALWLED